MVCEDGTWRSLDVLHDDEEGALGRDLHLREVLVINFGEQDHHLQ